MALSLTCTLYFLLPFPLLSDNDRVSTPLRTDSPLFNRVSWLMNTNSVRLPSPQHVSSLLSPVMNIIWVCMSSLLAFSPVFSDENKSKIRVFPAANQSIAGVIQVSYQNNRNQLQYAFNASEARKICHSLGLSIASKAQVQEALSRGLETCRFGWTDEQIGVIPRIHALANCGRNQTGLLLWRASVTNRFDVFCFNESDALIQLKDTVTDNPLSDSEHANSVNSTLTTQSASSSSTHPPSFTSTDEIKSNEVEPARFVGSAQTFAGSKVVLISCICGLLFTIISFVAYLKLGSHCHLRSEEKQQQQQDYTQTEEWISVKTIAETTKEVQEDQRIEVDNGKE
ncbi:lymphatic vessel endothelial hyaluronic acid receptor 1a [Gambusia affinis]|uniref:lymphatic vessel endothelial hyaluronic acid receptor 1a n=1 Tax=Gambusia affinis TaxID=33528 RepID=UPI001CDCE39B|nr:lymphatic vessel endothelial hyaluronic acid receptor 1a [Gambusia affinis]